VLAAALVLLGGVDSPAEDAPAKGALPADLDLVPREAAGFWSIRVADLWTSDPGKSLRQQVAKKDPEFVKQVEAMVGVDPSEVERLTFVMTRVPQPNEQGVPFAVLVATTRPYDKAKVLEALLPESREAKHKGKAYHASGDAALFPVSDRVFAMGILPAVELVIEQSAAKATESPLDDALALAAEKHHMTAGMNPAPFLRMINMQPNVPERLEPYRPLLESRALAAALDFGSEAKMFGRVTCAGEADAKEAAKSAKALAALIQQMGLPELRKEVDKSPGPDASFKKAFAAIDEALKAPSVETKGPVVHFSVTAKADLPTVSVGLLEMIVKARGVARRLGTDNNLRQIALAMHNYHSAEGAFPPAAITDKNGKALLSWRVAILPYVEQDQLYRQFRLDEPWDSAHNKKLLEKMPPIYAVPKEGQEPGTATHFRVFLGKGAAFEGDKGLTLGSFTDGTSNTLLAVEAADAVPWTKPEELSYDPKKALPKLGQAGAEKFHAVLADGSSKVLSKKIDESVLRAIITRNGGETVTIPE
jgi:hypothetical protein